MCVFTSYIESGLTGNLSSKVVSIVPSGRKWLNPVVTMCNFRDHNAGSEMLSKLAHPCPIQTIEHPILEAIVVYTEVSSGFRVTKSNKTLLVSPPRIVQWISCFGPSSKRHWRLSRASSGRTWKLASETVAGDTSLQSYLDGLYRERVKYDCYSLSKLPHPKIMNIGMKLIIAEAKKNDQTADEWRHFPVMVSVTQALVTKKVGWKTRRGPGGNNYVSGKGM